MSHLLETYMKISFKRPLQIPKIAMLNKVSLKFSSKMFAAKVGTQHISGTKVSFYVYRVKRK